MFCGRQPQPPHRQQVNAVPRGQLTWIAGDCERAHREDQHCREPQKYELAHRVFPPAPRSRSRVALSITRVGEAGNRMEQVVAVASTPSTAYIDIESGIQLAIRAMTERWRRIADRDTMTR